MEVTGIVAIRTIVKIAMFTISTAPAIINDHCLVHGTLRVEPGEKFH